MKYTTEKELFDFVSTKLKRLRIEKGYTNYEHLAYEIGLSRSQYGRYENGANMKLNTLLRILNHLEVTVEEFFEGIDDYKV